MTDSTSRLPDAMKPTSSPSSTSSANTSQTLASLVLQLTFAHSSAIL